MPLQLIYITYILNICYSVCLYMCTKTHNCIRSHEPAIKKTDNSLDYNQKLPISRYIFLNFIHTDIFRICFLLTSTVAAQLSYASSSLLLGLLWFTLPAWMLHRPRVPSYPRRQSHTLDVLLGQKNNNEPSANPVHSILSVLLRLNTAMQSTLCY